jgi:DNA-binding NarL/FixJ family response regulator
MKEKTSIRIILADDTLIAREGWKRILELEKDLVVVGEATTAQETLEKIHETNANMLLMDLKWSGDESAGWTAIQEIKREYPKVKIIAVTAYENLIAQARSVGADAALLKTFTREELINQIRSLASRPDTSVIVYPMLAKEKLSDRELQVLKLMKEGYRDREIATFLTIAPTTAKNHVKNILEKLGAKNRTQAVSIAREKGLL